MFRYTVKIVCGKGDSKVVAPGHYWTAINVLNPTDTEVSFRKRIIQALPEERVGLTTELFHAGLKPLEALEIDNQDIFKHFSDSTGKEINFLKGFVMIDSDNIELDVVAVYTAVGIDETSTRIAAREGIAIHVERVLPREV